MGSLEVRNTKLMPPAASETLTVVGKCSVTSKKRIVFVVGTRPEAIKLCPVVLETQRTNWAEPLVVATGQHLELLHDAMATFGVSIDHDLAIMTEAQTLSELTARAFERLDPCLRSLQPDIVIAQGDTTSVMTAGICCFYQRTLFGHVEAGLRTADIRAPFPEEFNRRVAGLVADLHFAPTERAKQNLEQEGVARNRIFLTGNTVIDALYSVLEQRPELPFPIKDGASLILMTAHRRESFGSPMRDLFNAVAELVARHPRLEVVYPVHPNPAVQEIAREILGRLDRVHLCEPLAYPQLVSVMARCDIVLTDSGGLQEEAPALGKPVLVVREQTERPEAVEMGVAKCVGTSRRAVVDTVSELLEDPEAYRAMARGVSPYGDGQASKRICRILGSYFEGTLAHRLVGMAQAR